MKMSNVSCKPRAGWGRLGWLVLFAGVLSSAAQSISDPDALRSKGDAASLRTEERRLRTRLLHQPGSADTLTRLGVVLQAQGRSAEAIAVLQRSLALRPDRQTEAQLAEERCRVGQTEAAAKAIAGLLDEPERNSIELLQTIAPCTMTLTPPALAVRAYSQLTALDREHGDADLLYLAQAFLAASRDAYSRLGRLAESAPLLAHFQAARGAGEFDTGAELAWLHGYDATIAADASAEQLLSQDSADARASLLYAIFITSEYAAEDQIEICHTRYPDSPRLAAFHAGMLAQQGDVAGAIRILEPLTTQADAERFRDALLKLYLANGEDERALALAKLQLATIPSDTAALQGEADALIKLQRFSELRALLEPRWRSGAPSWLSLALAQSQEQTGASQAAIRVLQAAEKSHPSDRTVHYRLLRLYVTTGQRRAAEAERVHLGDAAPAP